MGSTSETGRIELAERRLKAYVRFSEKFLEATRKEGISFTAEVAKSVTFFEWPTAIDIMQGVHVGIAAAISSGNRQLIAIASHLPIDFLIMSVKNKDFLFYSQMISEYPHILSLAYTVDRTDYRSNIIDSSWRSLRDYANYFLVHDIQVREEALKEEYIGQVLHTFSDLLKVAMDNNDVQTFGLLAREFNRLFKDLEVYHLPAEDIERLNLLVDHEQSETWFALGAWIIRSHVFREERVAPGQPNQKLIDPSLIGEFLEVATPYFKNVRELAEVYLRIHDQRTRGSRWENWLWQTLTEGEIHTIDFDHWLTWFYTVQGLRLSRPGFQAASDIPSPHIDLQHRLSDIEVNLDRIKGDPEGWAGLLPFLNDEDRIEDSGGLVLDSLESASDLFLARNRIAVQEWQRIREDEIISAELDSERVELYKEQSYQGWIEQAWLHQLLGSYSQIEELAAEQDETYLGFNFSMAKEAFISDRIVHYVGFGQGHGAQLARDVTDRLVGEMLSSAIELETATIESILERPEYFVPEGMGEPRNLTLIVWGRFADERKILSTPEFVPSWQEISPRFERHPYIGHLREVPVFFLFDESNRRALIVSTDTACTLLHHIPPADNYHGMKIRITEIDESEANRLIEAQPERLRDESGEPRPRNEVVRDLLLRAVVFLGVKYELRVDDPSALRLMPLLDDD